VSVPSPPPVHPDCDRLAAADTGLRDAAANLDLDRGQFAWCRDHRAALLRFHRSPPSAWLGAHEHERHALRGAFCRARGIPILRRLTGGEASYRDAQQLNLTLTVALGADVTRPPLGPWPALLGRALQTALERLGVAARFAPPHRLEIGGRTLGEVFIAVREKVLIAEAHLLRAIDTTGMLRVLRVPKEKLTPEGIRSARHRFATLDDPALDAGALQAAAHEAIAGALGLAPVAVAPAAWPAPMRADTDAAPAMNPDEPRELEGFVKVGGGVLYGGLRPDPSGRTIESLVIHGNVQFHPHGLLRDLSAAMAGVRLDAALERLSTFLAHRPCELLGFTAADLERLLRLLLGRRVLQSRLGLSAAEAGMLMVHDPAGTTDAPALLARAQAMLVPYCAKPTWCKWRHRDGCPECGRCAVGEAYRLGRARGMQVITIRDFEHLETALADLRDARVDAYLGMCCRHFFLKREYAFRAAGMPAVLIDITGANCYELQQEELAYAGRFAAQAELNLPVLRKVMAAVPACGPPIAARRGPRPTVPGEPTVKEMTDRR
jgi:lipoate-protein ligase A